MPGNESETLKFVSFIVIALVFFFVLKQKK